MHHLPVFFITVRVFSLALPLGFSVATAQPDTQEAIPAAAHTEKAHYQAMQGNYADAGRSHLDAAEAHNKAGNPSAAKVSYKAAAAAYTTQASHLTVQGNHADASWYHASAAYAHTQAGNPKAALASRKAAVAAHGGGH